MFKLLTIEELTKAIASIGRSGVRLIAAIQSAAVQVIGHAVMHGDVRPANSLIDATSKHQRAALIAFLEAYGPFAYSKSDKDVKFYANNKRLKDAGIERNTELPQAYVASLPRWESMAKPAEPRSVYDVQEEADKFITRMRKMAAVSTNTVKHQKLLDELTAAYNHYVAQLALGEAADNPVGDNVQFEPLKAVNS